MKVICISFIKKSVLLISIFIGICFSNFAFASKEMIICDMEGGAGGVVGNTDCNSKITNLDFFSPNINEVDFANFGNPELRNSSTIPETHINEKDFYNAILNKTLVIVKSDLPLITMTDEEVPYFVITNFGGKGFPQIQATVYVYYPKILENLKTDKKNNLLKALFKFLNKETTENNDIIWGDD